MSQRHSVLADPTLIDLLDGNLVDVIPAKLALPAHHHQTGIGQYLEVFHHRKARNFWKVLAKLTRGRRLLFEKVQDLPPGRVGQRFPYVVRVGVFHVTGW